MMTVPGVRGCCWRRFYHDFLIAEQDSVRADPPVVFLHQVSEDQLDSGSRLVPVGCGLVSLGLVVSSHSTDKDCHSGIDGVRKVLGLRIHTEGISLAPAIIECSMWPITCIDSFWWLHLVVDGLEAGSATSAWCSGCGNGMLKNIKDNRGVKYITQRPICITTGIIIFLQREITYNTPGGCESWKTSSRMTVAEIKQNKKTFNKLLL